MPIVSVSRWKLSAEHAQQAARDIAPALKENGASEVSIGRIHTGEHTGEILFIVSYPDGETFGRAVDARAKNETYRQRLDNAMQNGTLLGRTVVLTENIG